MGQISRVKDNEIQNGNLINADDIDAELDQLVNESNLQDTRVQTIESGAIIIGGTKTFSNAILIDGINEKTPNNGVSIDGVTCKDGRVNIGISSDPSSISDGDLWINTADDKLKSRLAGVTRTLATETFVTNNSSVPDYYISGAAPVHVTGATFTVARTYAKDNTSTNVINISASKTVDISTSGVNGLATDATEAADTFYYLYAISDPLSSTPDPGYLISPKSVSSGDTLTGLPDKESALLTGTVSTTSGQDLITGDSTTFTADFVPGQKIEITSGNTLIIQSVDSDTQMTATANATTTSAAATYKRLSPYSDVVQLPYVMLNNASSNLIPQYVCGGYPFQTQIQYIYNSSYHTGNGTIQDGDYTSLLRGTSTTEASVDISNLVPPEATHVVIQIKIAPSGASAWGYVRGDQTDSKQDFGGDTLDSRMMVLPVLSSKTLYYRLASAVGDAGINIDVIGYTIKST